MNDSRVKLYKTLQNVYGKVMSIAFFAGIVPLPVFIASIIAGPSVPALQTASVWMYKTYYPIFIALGSIAVLIGLVAMYAGKKEGLSIKSVNNNDPERNFGAKEAMSASKNMIEQVEAEKEADEKMAEELHHKKDD